jgi:Lipocalin-like domain
VSDDRLVGTWRLVSFEMRDEDGRVTHPLGGDAVGFITYTPDGHMAVQFGRADRARLAVGDWAFATPAEIATAARDYFEYCGTYELRDGEVGPDAELDRQGTGAAGHVRRRTGVLDTAHASRRPGSKSPPWHGSGRRSRICNTL